MSDTVVPPTFRDRLVAALGKDADLARAYDIHQAIHDVENILDAAAHPAITAESRDALLAKAEDVPVKLREAADALEKVIDGSRKGHKAAHSAAKAAHSEATTKAAK